MALAGGFQKGGSLSSILFSGPWVKESCVPPPGGGRLPAAEGHLRRMALLSPSHHYLPRHIYRCTLSEGAPRRFLFPSSWPPMDTGACLLFAVRCIVTRFDLLLFEPDAVCLVAFNPLKGWRMQFIWMMALYQKAKSYCTSCLSGTDCPVSTPTLTKRLMNQEVPLGGFKCQSPGKCQRVLAITRLRSLLSSFCTQTPQQYPTS